MLMPAPVTTRTFFAFQRESAISWSSSVDSGSTWLVGMLKAEGRPAVTRTAGSRNVRSAPNTGLGKDIDVSVTECIYSSIVGVANRTRWGVVAAAAMEGVGAVKRAMVALPRHLGRSQRETRRGPRV